MDENGKPSLWHLPLAIAQFIFLIVTPILSVIYITAWLIWRVLGDRMIMVVEKINSLP